MISVLILEERSHVRDALGQLISWKQPTFELAAACAHAGEARVLIDQGLSFEVVVLDPSTATGAESLASMGEIETPKPIVGFCDQGSPELLMTFLRAGGSSLILKEEGPERLLLAIEATLKGGASFSPSLTQLLANWVLSPQEIPRTQRPEHLTPREIDVLSSLAAGHTYAEVGETLGIGLGTVQSHVKNIYRKLDVKSKTEASTLAITEGLVPAPSRSTQSGGDTEAKEGKKGPLHWTSEQTP